jgi:AmmeMemoRadiSam system protein A
MPAREVVGPAGRSELLKIARQVVTAAASGHASPDCQPEGLPELDQPCGAFVTLNTRDGRLRGCIGTFTADKPLWQTVAEMARSAATADPRFLPVGADELDNIEIEVSVLSPLERSDDPLSLELGVHGIYIMRNGRGGTFLPQVATEHGMSKEEFLSTCCAHKAGLPPDAWKDPETEVYLYTAQVFGEK